MKPNFYLLFSILLMLGSLNVSAQIGIGTTTPAPSAALEVTSSTNNKGVLIPRITATQKDAISSPAQGLLIYQTTAPIGFYYYIGTAWKLIANQADTELKVDKIAGKDLSSNDYTTAEKTKLAAITGLNTGDQTTITGNAGTATKLAASKNINGVAFDGSADITIAAAASAEQLTGTTLKSTVTGSSLTSVGTLGNLTVTNPIAGSVTGNAGTATKLASSKNINGVAFDGSADITIAASAATITGIIPVDKGGTGQTTVPGILSTLGFASNNVAIGNVAGTPNQGVNANTIAIGGGAGRGNQGAASVAIGYVSGDQNQGSASVAIGSNAAQSNQGTQAVALGYAAGQNGQGAYSVALGSFAGNSQAANSIALNATGAVLNPSTTGFFVNPIINRTATSTALYYNTTTKEVTSGTAASGGVPYTGATGAVDLGAYDLKVNDLTVGKGGGNGATNTANGQEALYSNTIGSNNTANGQAALRANTTGTYNTATGNAALYSNTTGAYNTANGQEALYSNTEGGSNTANGRAALRANTTGTYNTATGNAALYSNTIGNSNTANGQEALYSNTIGDNNTANGQAALRANTTGILNTATGASALKSNMTGSQNTANGMQALYSNTTGGNNTAIGKDALLLNTTGLSNTAIGYEAGNTHTTGNNNTFIGYGATGSSATASNQVILGNTSVTNVKTSGTITAGAVTYPNSDGAAGTVLTANANGIPTWTAAAGGGGTHTIGELYGGGIVFYVYDGGKHGLIAATSDQSTGIRWYGGSNTNTRARADGVGAGLKNTAIIIANQGSVDGNAFAATVCNEYSVTKTVGGITTTYGDWYLPSIYELNLMYTNIGQGALAPNTNIGYFAETNYWSSTESDFSLAYSKGFWNNNQGDYSKLNASSVRAIRAF